MQTARAADILMTRREKQSVPVGLIERHPGEHHVVDPKDSYWRRQFYFASSIGIFYILIIALFGIPLLGTFVVILIKGALDLRYLIIAGGCVGAVALAWFTYRGLKKLWWRIQRDGTLAGETARRNLLMGKPFEISIFSGMLRFSCGQPPSDAPLALPHSEQALLPQETGRTGAAGILDQLDRLAELKRSGDIDDDEFNLLKTMLIESSDVPKAVENDHAK
ncbi:SHOCT domain-containing protein [Desulfosarcina ovata]|uniref:SHOCT domain-containing protein n=1 Tax=Desulfosarcina ovata subsp. ovata TaxID=2752305 RepID=A0A5K8A8T8_9BACT|nr:SHOCT domain-containing protein [Desulfosarcina ovata]BBO88945.1 hypothetical protein DSCOOX_21250 [Desulfosarcina ovata subsp. ovata]